ncbi:lipid droplet-associated protein [Nocardia sp. NBC_00508]|uniref:lipid droplet-associated protein n=1 Tax=Nocardia sp. NBC_00508 TaxID=2975992 RepID=UPI002E8025CB|nr:lipid droplet-associated protein [Nocardia sp. NBC_00508]WUD64191.1 lipid droplet-associated protein [Nocardia sp. NBC_00508]
MLRPPFLARVAAGAAVYALEETRRLPTAAMNFPITAISQMLQTTMHVQQFVTSLALKGDAVFDRLSNRPVDQPEWATFDEDLADDPSPVTPHTSRFDLYTADEAEPAHTPENFPADAARATETNGHTTSVPTIDDPAEPKTAEPESESDPEPAAAASEIVEPEVATRYDYVNMTLAQLRARLRMLTVEDLIALLEYEQHTRARAPFVTMLTNRIATVQAQ